VNPFVNLARNFGGIRGTGDRPANDDDLRLEGQQTIERIGFDAARNR
jgi:hypothetical protein